MHAESKQSFSEVGVDMPGDQPAFAPEWHWKSTGTNGGKIVGSCKTPKEIGETVVRLAEHPETEQIHIFKFRRDYDPMLPESKMQEIINATGDERERIIARLSSNTGN